MLHKAKQILVVLLVRTLLAGLRLFWRVRYFDRPDDSKSPLVYAHWHGDELLLLPVFAHRHYAVMSSRSRDGELMSSILRGFGYRVVRGSSSRGGVGGLKGLIDCVAKEQLSAAVAVDGPRGPFHVVKPGVLFLAQAAGLPIVPAAAAASRVWKIKGAWNQGYVPKPFSRCAVVFGEPIPVPQDCSDAQWENLRLTLQNRLELLKQQAAAHIAGQNLPAIKVLGPQAPSPQA